MIPLSDLTKSVRDGLAFLRAQDDRPSSVILSGHLALARYRLSSRRNLGSGWVVGQNLRSQVATVRQQLQ